MLNNLTNELNSFISSFLQEEVIVKDTPLSNMYPCKIKLNDLTFLSSESLYQALKCPSRLNEFTSLNGYQAKRLGKTVQLLPNWEEIKLQVMEEILYMKFTQNQELKEYLLSTGSKLIIERNEWRDSYWGVYKGYGHNHLGRLLMKIREELRPTYQLYLHTRVEEKYMNYLKFIVTKLDERGLSVSDDGSWFLNKLSLKFKSSKEEIDFIITYRADEFITNKANELNIPLIDIATKEGEQFIKSNFPFTL